MGCIRAKGGHGGHDPRKTAHLWGKQHDHPRDHGVTTMTTNRANIPGHAGGREEEQEVGEMANEANKESIAQELRALTGVGIWAEHYERCRTSADRLAHEAGRFRDALRVGGVDASVVEVRAALLEHAGLADEDVSTGSSGSVTDLSGNTGLEVLVDDRHADRAASRALYLLYEEGCRIELHDGELRVAKTGSLADEQRLLLREHSEGLGRLLSEEAMREVWTPAVRYVATHLQLAGALEGPRYDQAVGSLDGAQDAYESGDDGLCRFLLQRAALAAAGRLGETHEEPPARGSVSEGSAVADGLEGFLTHPPAWWQTQSAECLRRGFPEGHVKALARSTAGAALGDHRRWDAALGPVREKLRQMEEGR